MDTKILPSADGMPELKIEIQKGDTYGPELILAQRMARVKPVCRCKGDSATGEITEQCAFHRNAIAMFHQLRALTVLDISLKNPARAIFDGFVPTEQAEAKFSASMAQIQRLMLAICIRAEKDEADIIDVKSGAMELPEVT